MHHDLVTWYLINKMSEDSNYLADKDINDVLVAEPDKDYSGPLDNNCDDGHIGENLGLDNPNNPFAFDNNGVTNDDELHIADHEFISNVNVHPTTTITAMRQSKLNLVCMKML